MIKYNNQDRKMKGTNEKNKLTTAHRYLKTCCPYSNYSSRRQFPGLEPSASDALQTFNLSTITWVRISVIFNPIALIC